MMNTNVSDSPLRFIQSVLGRTSLAHHLAFRNFRLSAEWNQPLFFCAGVRAGALKASRFDRIKYNRAVGEACALSHIILGTLVLSAAWSPINGVERRA